MVNYKLTYFNIRARGEVIRLIFAYVGKEFEDHRITGNEWAQLKPQTPMGQIPVLEVDGKKLCQSMAIARYLAREFGIAGDSNFEQALADMYVDGIQDLTPALMPLRNAPADQKKEIYNKIKSEALIPFMDRFQQYISSNDSGFLVGKKITWADIVLADRMNKIQDQFDQAVMKDHPKIEQHLKAVFNEPKINKYIANRPDAPM